MNNQSIKQTSASACASLQGKEVDGLDPRRRCIFLKLGSVHFTSQLRQSARNIQNVENMLKSENILNVVMATPL